MPRKLFLLLIACIIALTVVPPPTTAQDEVGWFITVPGIRAAVVPSPDGQTVAMFNQLQIIQIRDILPTPDDMAIWLVDLDSGETRTLPGTSSLVSDVAFSPDGSLLAASHLDNYLTVTDVASGERVAQFTAPGSVFVEFLDNQTVLAVTSGLPLFLIYDLGTGYITTLHAFHHDYESWPDVRGDLLFSDIALTADRTQVAFLMLSGTVYLLNLEDGQFTEVRAADSQEDSPVPRGNAEQVEIIQQTNTVTYLERGGRLVFIDIATLEEIQVYDGTEIGRNYAITPDGAWIVWTDRVNINLSSIPSPDMVIPIEITLPSEVEGGPRNVTLTPDGRQIIASQFTMVEDDVPDVIYVIDLPQ